MVLTVLVVLPAFLILSKPLKVLWKRIATVIAASKCRRQTGAQSFPGAADAEKGKRLKTVYGGEPHAGGAFWDAGSPDYTALRQWIAGGALKE